MFRIDTISSESTTNSTDSELIHKICNVVYRMLTKEQGCYTRLGYWNDRKGENEIDIIAEDEVDNKIEFIEVKRQSKNFDEELLKSKAATFMKAVGPYEGYEISYKGISIDDM